jgi:uncharacterized protein (TIGR03083 family)
MTSATTEGLYAETVAQREALAELLGTLSAADWERPSLCAGWRIRETVAHITMPFRYSTAAVLLEVLRARGRFDVATDRLARRDAVQSTDELLAGLVDNVAHRWAPPGGGQLGALSHDVIHGLDITEALGHETVSPPSRLATVLGGPRLAGAFKVDLSGVRLVASDADVAVGEGHEVSMSATDVLLVCTARKPVPPVEQGAAG